MQKELSAEDLQMALTDPASVFPAPQAVLDQVGLTDRQKIEILRRWEYDARELMVMEEEALPATGPSATLDLVLRALHELGAVDDAPHPSPTKQGGV
ncbi:MAG: hypothetical protein R3176_11005 [Woeseiaceae bacterium]|nr:hypothetical protein [Woeseiaceae bacterium]